MRGVLLIFFGMLVLAAANQDIDLDEEDYDETWQGGKTRGLILSSQGKKAFKSFVSQMPCGWPDLGIPPLAPYTNADLNLQASKSIIDLALQFIRFRFDGLDLIDIKKLKVSYVLSKKVKYHFVFPELKATAEALNTNTFIDVLNQLGVSVRYEGSGPLEFALENLSIEGQFNYKVPFLFGSIKISKFKATVTLGGLRSNIGGILGNGKLNRYLNEQLENIVVNFINNNQKDISAQIENVIVPRVNGYLKGHKIWWLISKMLKSTTKCNPTPAPWLALE